MSERTETAGVAVAVAMVLVLLLLVVAGGGVLYVIQSRQASAVRAEAMMARAAAVQAQRNVEQARALERAATAEALAIKSTTPQLDQGTPAAVEAFLRAQAEAWNAGDMDVFMDHYWKSDELTFSSGGQTTRGWNATLNRYREKYPTRDQMGQLKFDQLEITPLGETAALVLGRWQVQRDAEPLSGNFSLVVRKVADRWLIIHDHTSRLSPLECGDDPEGTPRRFPCPLITRR